MLGWWYSQGWLWVAHGIQQRLQDVSRTFAVRILLKTWFSPWKQIYSESTFATFFRDAADNAVSRCIGAVIRGAILFWALLLAIVIGLIGVVCLVVWPLIPLLIVILPILTVTGASL